LALNGQKFVEMPMKQGFMLFGIVFAIGVSVAVVVFLGGEPEGLVDVVGMFHLSFWLKSKEVPQRTRPPVFSVDN
jgi:hypothetical protein